MKKFLKILGIGVIVAMLLFIINFVFNYNPSKVISLRYLVIGFGINVLYSVPIALSCSYYFEYLNTKVQWKKYMNQRVLIGVLGSLMVVMITVFIIRVFHKVVIDDYTFAQFLKTERFKFYFLCVIIASVVSLFFHFIFFYKAYQKNKIRDQKIIADMANAKFEALKNQLDPHFLFNSLNVLTSLIEENPEQAKIFTIELSKIYRYVLEHKTNSLVSINDELSFAKTYMLLLKMRFEDSIVFNINVDASIGEGQVIPLSLQLLLENAVKHNVVTSSRPLQIWIYESKGYLVVKNSLNAIKQSHFGSGLGLNNINERYKIIADNDVIVVQNETFFEVKLPIIKH